MFEITADHIARLNDTDLRALVGQLCEAELRKKGLPTSAVTWGGDQNAVDGGVDVRVDLGTDAHISGFIPRSRVGYQVKSEDMPRKQILDEMCPGGLLRASIQDLADQSGAYIIVSSRGSTTDTALSARRTAMQDAVAGIRNADRLFQDFFDRTRITTWVRDHFAMILWVRQKVGRAIPGWHPFGAWVHLAGGIGEEYFTDERARIQTGRREDDSGLPVLQGISRIRAILREPRTVVRLVGMPGVGKTRLVQALFEDGVGNDPIDPTVAIYTNIADSPDPNPTNLASDLVGAGLRNILVIDNCTPDLHRRLSEVCRTPESQLSVITIEYDIREDEPEGTEVFKLEAASLDLIEHIVRLQFPHISEVDVRKIAEFSSGNARIAISLAARLEKSETVAGLNDDELFRRLFDQRHQRDPILFTDAQACSFLYSFQIEPVSGPDAELPCIGALVNRSAEDVFASVAELSRRDLMQHRGYSRAVLPHAIANRLATYALQNIPMTKIEKEFIEKAPPRFLKSLSRRLGYLHDRPEAVAIAKKFLKAGGLLGDVCGLNEIKQTAFANIAPAAPDDALAALERALNGLDGRSTEPLEPYVPLLHSLAYSPEMFERAATILGSIAGAEKEKKQKNKAAEVFLGLFYLYLSGTHASVEQRLRIVDQLLSSDKTKNQELAVQAIRAALESNHFTLVSMFDFGARPRDYGYRPHTREDLKNWFVPVLRFVERYVQSAEPIGKELLKVLAEQFRGLWSAGMHEELTHLCNVIAQKQHWPDGWLAVRETLQFDHKDQQSESDSTLIALDRLLQPRSLIQRVRSVVLSDSALIDVDTSVPPIIFDASSAYERGELIAYELGKEAARDESSLRELLPELMIARTFERLWPFGRGLAESFEDPEGCWHKLVRQMSLTVPDQRSPRILGGFLVGLGAKQERLVAKLLDQAVDEDTLTEYFPLLQAAVYADADAARRLRRAVTLKKSPIHRFRALSGGRWSEPLSGSELGGLLLQMAEVEGGLDVAVQIFSMRLFADKNLKRPHHPEIIQVGRQLIERFPIEDNHRSNDHYLGDVIETCLSGPDGMAITRTMCERFKAAVKQGAVYGFYRGDLIRALLKVQPGTVFDVFLAECDPDDESGMLIMKNIDSSNKGAAVSGVPAEEILAWCNVQPMLRFPRMAALIDAFQDESTEAVRWSDAARCLLEAAPEPTKVLEQFVLRIEPLSWSGSRAAIVNKRLELLKQMETDPEPSVAKYAGQEYIRLRRAVEEEKKAEKARYKMFDQTFE